MGHDFDDNGKYIGWSDLFDLSSQETLKASEYLPTPDNETYMQVRPGKESNLDISEEFQKILTSPNRTAIIRNIADLLIKLSSIKASDKLDNRNRPIKYLSWNNISENVTPSQAALIYFGLAHLETDSDTNEKKLVYNDKDNLTTSDLGSALIKKLNIHSHTQISPDIAEFCIFKNRKYCSRFKKYGYGLYSNIYGQNQIYGYIQFNW